ncbi:Uncharacterised protein [Vibrio cholerae]|nr:Uncharacterised protein [Vibrio cholerae]CSB80672.1 Uncharacterised protein [Vibrio cholerae]
MTSISDAPASKPFQIYSLNIFQAGIEPKRFFIDAFVIPVVRS